VYNSFYLLFSLDECLLCWLGWFQTNQHNRQSSKKNNKYIWLYLLMMGLDTPATCRSVWRNMLRIRCASSWFFFSQLHKVHFTFAYVFIYTVPLEMLLLITQSANQHMHTFNFLFIKTYLKFLKTLLHVSVIRPSSGSL